jgi:large subunit ribosomal protein L31
MKSEIHPEYVVAHVKCTCGNEFETRATRPEYHLEICSQCHPFYTGRQKLVDTGGRVERFQRRVAKGRLASAGAARGRRGTTATAGASTAGAADGGAERETGSTSAEQATSGE